MGQSYRIRTELGITKSINVELEQEFEFLEILSLKLNQTDIYLRSCSDYGVLVGRVTANNGLGLPNARVSVFIPIEALDESNPIISSIYPYKSPLDKNEDGFRYNLLPYEKSYSTHSATGTLPTRLDVLTGNTVFEIYEKYYKFTAKTNESGDYMIMGVPLGTQTVVMDVDLSDIGEFSLTPQDLIRIGLATEAQVAGNRFRTSSDLDTLPQIINITKTVDVTPLWGEPSLCQISINRVDFDLRDEANVDIQPTAVFMGSIFSTSDQMRIRPQFSLFGLPFNGPKDNFGNLCSLETGTGQILAIRQTINLDVSGNPILEQYQLEQNGNVIDGDGSWLLELPMNLDYFYTNEFGVRVISYDPTIGVPTKAKYRFKIKWTQAANFTDGVRRPYYLLPNVREYGWSTPSSDPNLVGNSGQRRRLSSSYYFGLDWSGYTDGFSSQESNTRINEIINCEDTFYQFEYNRVYTPSSLIDQYKYGGRSRFIGIKEIDDNSCEDNVNKFPVNEGFRNFDLLYFIVSLVLQIFQLISPPIFVVIHFAKAILDGSALLRTILAGYFYVVAGYWLTLAIIDFIAAVQFFIAAANTAAIPGLQFEALALKGLGAQALEAGGQYLLLFGKNLAVAIGLTVVFRILKGKRFKVMTLPALTYPDCEGCPCSIQDIAAGDIQDDSYTVLTPTSGFWLYQEKIKDEILTRTRFSVDDYDQIAFLFSTSFAGNPVKGEAATNLLNSYGVPLSKYKTTESEEGFILNENDNPRRVYFWSNYLPWGERVNLFNTRKKFFDGLNQIRVTFDFTGNTGFHLDNTLCVFFQDKMETGQMMTFVDPTTSRDPNYKYIGNQREFSNGITGTPLNIGASIYDVKFANPNNQYNEIIKRYNLGYGSSNIDYKLPSDVEYYQVVTAMTMNEAIDMFILSTPEGEGLRDVILGKTGSYYNLQERILGIIPIWGNTLEFTGTYAFRDMFENFDEQYLTIIQRGVDPYSPKYNNKFDLNALFGYPMGTQGDLVITASTRLNIPIQKLNTQEMTVQPFTVNGQNEIFYPSHFFRGGVQGSTTVGTQWSAFTSSIVGYYSSLDAKRVFRTGVPQPGSDAFIPSPTVWVHSVGANYNNAVTVPPDGNSFDGSFTSGRSTYNSPGGPVSFYQTSEDLSGAAYFTANGGSKPSETTVGYWTRVFYPFFSANPMNITSNVNNVLRTDRLPSSDILDGDYWETNPSLLQQNLNFGIYLISESGESGEVIPNTITSTGAQQVSPDIAGQFASDNVFDTFECPNIVSLNCYEGTGTGFTVNRNCANNDDVQSGCYTFAKRIVLDIPKDIRNFNEWAYRFRFFYGMCRGVLSQSFTNNWVNGSLFMFPIQVDVTFDRNNKANPPNYPKNITFFDSKTNNFYYRSSPFISGYTPSEFIGIDANTTGPQFSLNERNLLFPTTIMNLGMKDSFYGEIILEPSTNAYVMNNLNPTSYSDTSDLVNLFVISRITNKTFLQQMLNSRDNSVNSLFTRNGQPNSIIFNPKSRLDADLAQLMSINSEVGLIPFSPQYYPFSPNNPDNAVNVYTQGLANPTIGVFFSSNTENLQTKDFLTPGLINFRFNPNVTAVVYNYGIKSQRVPLYQWELTPGPQTRTIFGSETNNWRTRIQDIVSSPYQSLNRRSLISPNYFVPSNTALDVNQRGYIFNKNAQGSYDGFEFPGMDTKFIVGAPFHFYFGVVKGNSALDKFKQKYLPNE